MIPAQGSPGTWCVAMTMFVAGSIRRMTFGLAPATQTASGVMATQSAVRAILIVANIGKANIGR
jgi:hypothetical protein